MIVDFKILKAKKSGQLNRQINELRKLGYECHCCTVAMNGFFYQSMYLPCY